MRDNAKSGALTEVTFFILLSLYKPNHGYGIMQFIAEKTGERLSLGAGSLYGAINALNEKNWIKPYSCNDPRKKEYIITPLGKDIAEAEVKRLSEVLAIANQIMGGALL